MTTSAPLGRAVGANRTFVTLVSETMAIRERDDAALADGLSEWWDRSFPVDAPVRVESMDRPDSGWSNETLLVTFTGAAAGSGSSRCVVRVPPEVPTFPHHDLVAQADVQRALGAAGVPTSTPIAVEDDDRWLGSPFLVMSFEAGRPIGEVACHDPWLAAIGVEEQRKVHERFLTMLAAVHRVDWATAGLGERLRGSGRSVADEVDWWCDYVEWSADGAPTPRLRTLASWCRRTAPDAAAPASLCWGDARFGNVLFDEAGEIASVLDWELASIGPAEMDLAWHLALEAVTASFTRATVPGFLDRDAAIAAYEAALGRPVEHLAWHEVFALVRSVAINERQARQAAAAGVDYRGIAGDDNPMLRYIERSIERLEGR